MVKRKLIDGDDGCHLDGAELIANNAEFFLISIFRSFHVCIKIKETLLSAKCAESVINSHSEQGDPLACSSVIFL